MTSTPPSYTLAELAERFGLTVHGDAAARISGVCELAPGEAGRVAFLANPKYRAQLSSSQAGAVIVGRRDAAALPGNGLIAAEPHLAYARVARLFDPSDRRVPGIHATASIAPGVRIPHSAQVSAYALIEDGVEIGEEAYIGPHCHVGRGAHIGAGTRLEARVWIGPRVRIGERGRINPGAVIGARGFGFAPSREGWQEVPQLGTVVIGDDVEVGANTCIDRGALSDTKIGNGVKLDNLIMIAHNVEIGERTAIAACTGIAGSTRIGARCMIGGAAGINGHIEICDDVVLLGRAMVTKSITQKGVYGSGLPLAPVREWHQTVARVRRLHRLEQRLRDIEQQLGIDSKQEQEDASEP
ncbi:MAG TPA: UDP-3-O-(3-hydroxymyristoyl)glucosamine N-acyltransferase [Nevskiaceae bacterium]|nr:UDP-3-O-(3-hydroxymyristoyl)glucosamine N-acyltransferase [Nevskiaceae bacterium]